MLTVLTPAFPTRRASELAGMEAGRVGSGCGDVAAVEGAGWTFQRRGVCAEVARAIGSRVPMRPPRQVSRCRLFLSFIGLSPCVYCDCRPIITTDKTEEHTAELQSIM